MLRSIVLLNLAFILLPAALPAMPAHAQPVERIAAVVNDEVISQSDVSARLRLALLSIGLPPTPENQQRLAPQVLRGLVDEKLQQQEANRFNITVTQAEIDREIGSIATRNGLSADHLRAALAQSGVPIATLEQQIRSALSWRKLIERRLTPTIEIGDDEINEVLQRVQANRGRPEYLVAEIALTVDNPADDAEVRRFAEQLVREMQQGARFSQVARQFSQSAGAANGGDIGWVTEGQLDPALDAVLRTMAPGSLSAPVRTLSGYHILLLREQRRASTPDINDTQVTLRRIALPLPRNPSRPQLERLAATAQSVSERVRGCDALAQKAAELGASETLDMGTGRLGSLPPPLRALVQDLPVGQPTAPQRLVDGIAVFMVCDRQAPTGGDVNRDAIANSLGQERLDMLQRRYLRDLRNAAFIDVRV